VPDITPLFTVANQVLVNFFDKNSSGNYVSHIIEDNESGQEYLITMQRIEGETPLHQLAQQKDRVQALEHALTQVLTLANRGSDDFGGPRPDIAERVKEALVHNQHIPQGVDL
jgi:hypothetical protein